MATATAPRTETHDEVWDIPVGGNGGGGDYVCCPAGNHPATIVGMFDVGSHPAITMEGKAIDRRKLVMVYELKKKRPDGKPFVLGREYTWSMSENAHLFKDVTNITGRKYQDGDKFNPLGLLGTPVMVTVTNQAKGEKTYHNVSSISQFPEEFPAPEPSYHPVSWSVVKGDPFPAGLDWLPFVYGKSIKGIAFESIEARGRSGSTPAPAASAAPGDDDIPF